MDSQKPAVMILGTTHLANPDNGDLFRVQADDVLAEKRQSEIKDLITALKEFNPTKVALEVLGEHESKLNEEYRKYIKDDFELSASEHHQLGFRLAQATGLEEVEAIDWNGEIEGVPDIGQWVAENGSELMDEVLEKGRLQTNELDAFLKNHSLREFLLWLNLPENIRRNQEMYMKMALIGDQENPVGAIWTGQYWYYRNLRIYKNIIDLADSPNQRIFVLYGAGHLHLLNGFLQESGLVHIVDVRDYLAEADESKKPV